MLPGLLTNIDDFDDRLVRNIKGIRVSQNLFDDLAESDEEHLFAMAAADQDYIESRSPLVTRPFDYGAVVTYPFVPQNWQMTRFSDGAHYGVWYGSLEIETTIYETAYHWQRFVLDSFANYDGLIRADRRVFTARCQGILIDLSCKDIDFPNLIHPVSYAFTHQLGHYLHTQRQNGLLVKSARCEGINGALFSPDLLSEVKDLCYLTYESNPAMGLEVSVKRELSKSWMLIPAVSPYAQSPSIC